jgi:2-phospho-L-lactate guanylyltransferase
VTCFAVLPVKSFARGKSRLAPVMPPPARARIARALCERSLAVLAACPALAGTLVVTDGEEVARLARAGGALVLRSDARLAGAVDLGLALLARAGASHALVLMADLPRLTPAAVARLVARLDRHDAAVAPDHALRGTSALLVPAGAPRTAFGRPDSFARHLARLSRAGLSVAAHRDPRLAFDLDTPADLATLLA